MSFTNLHQETIEWEGKRYFTYMAASAYQVISTEIEIHIFKHDWIFRHLYAFMNILLWQSSGILIFLCKYYIVVSDTLVGIFLRCALFVARCNTIRTSWENQKERLSYRKKYVEEFAWGISLLWLHAILSMPFCRFLRLLPPLSQMTHLRNGR